MLLTGKQGFTLIEVLIAVVLIGILLGITLPNFSGLLTSMEAKTTGRQLVSNLERIRARAIIDDQLQQVAVKEEKLIYQPQDEAEVKLGTRIKKLSWSEKKKKIKFFPDGRSSGGELTVVTEAGNKLKIIINQVTGQVELGD